MGEVLFDVFPDARRIGGAPFNFAFQMHRLGFPVLFVSAVGGDEAGREILAFMERSGMRTDGVQRRPAMKTGEVLVRLGRGGIPGYEILEDRAWDRIGFDPVLESLLEDGIGLACYGTLAQRSFVTRETLARILDRLDPRVLRVCDLNLRQDYYSPSLIEQSIRNAGVLKVNEEELSVIGGLFRPGGEAASPGSRDDTAAALVARFGLRCLCVTLGAAGSALYLPGGRVLGRPAAAAPSPDGAVADTVGAGDGYTAMLCAGLMRGLEWEKVIDLAARFASALCTVRGALPEGEDFYRPFRRELEGSGP